MPEPARPSVLELLAPLTSQYVRRATGPQSCQPPKKWVDSSPAPRYVPCVVQSIVTVDRKGRVWLPRVGMSLDNAVVRLGDGTTLVVGYDESVGASPVIDGRGRVQLPHGLMHAVGIGLGDRVAIIRRLGRDDCEIVSTERLGVSEGLG